MQSLIEWWLSASGHSQLGNLNNSALYFQYVLYNPILEGNFLNCIVLQELHAGKRGMAELANSKKILESKLAEYTAKITEITNINTSLASIKVKLEKDLTQVSASYEDMAKELKLADDRANKAAHDAQHFEGLLRYEITLVPH